jgi:choloylglycine hydrolase
MESIVILYLKSKRFALSLLAGCLATMCCASGFACTAMVITDADGAAYNGKTMEFSYPIPLNMEYVPAGTKISSKTPTGKTGIEFNTKYPILGLGMLTFPGANQDTMVEAINNQGLSVSSNEFNDSKGPTALGSDEHKILAATDFAMWILGNFQSVQQVKQALLAGDVKIWLPKVPFLGNAAMPIHYAVFDKTGAGIVIEYSKGQQNIYDNEVGVMTNIPDFSWHLQNLNNYAFLSNVDRNHGKFNNLEVSAPDSGNALVGLPSDQTSAGRFVKAAYYTSFVRKAKTADDAIITLAHILNNFDRPYNLSIDPPGAVGDGPALKTNSSEVTMFTWLSDKTRNRYYLRTIDSYNFTMIDMNKLAGEKKIKKIPISMFNTMSSDSTHLLLNQ